MNNQQMMELTTVEKSAFEELVKQCTRSGSIDPSLYVDYDVKRGLRDSNGNGVLTGLTEISDVVGTRSDNGRKVPVDGELYFQGFNVAEIIAGFGDRKYVLRRQHTFCYSVSFQQRSRERILFIFLPTLKSFQEHSFEM